MEPKNRVDSYTYRKEKFPNVREARIKKVIFVGPQIRELMNDKNSEGNVNVVKNSHLIQSFGGVICP